MKDATSRTEDQAGRIDRLNASDYRDVDWDDGVTVEPQHAHGPGLICLLCALDKAREPFAEAERLELLVCDGCSDLYDNGCTHGFYLCGQCVGRCSECVQERADDARGDAKEEGA